MDGRSTDSNAAIFLRFLKFGALAWGGPAAQIEMIRKECVEEEGWITPDAFKKTLAVYQVLPGPEAHELCVYFGRIRGGKTGGFLAGLGFMLPGFILMLAFSVAYVQLDTRTLQNDGTAIYKPSAAGYGLWFSGSTATTSSG